MENLLKGTVAFKGEQGDSAYDIAVRNGFEGTEKDWLATLGTAEHLTRTVVTMTISGSPRTITLSEDLTSQSVADVYVNGLRRAENTFTLDRTAKTITFTEALKSGDLLEVYIMRMRDSELPIVTTISDSSTDESAPSAKAVNTMKKELMQEIEDLGSVAGNLSIAIDNKMNFDNIAVITGSQSGIGAGETVIVDVNYPDGFTQADTVIIGKMVSSNSNYYDTDDTTPTASGFPRIEMVALTSSTIRIWLNNANSTQARAGHFKITLLKTTAY